VIVPMLELVTSPAPVYAGELLVALFLTWVVADARRKEQAARDEIQIHAQRFITDFTDLIVPLGGAPEEADRLLFLADGTDLPSPVPEAEPTAHEAPEAGGEGQAPGYPATNPASDADGERPIDHVVDEPAREDHAVADPWSLA